MDTPSLSPNQGYFPAPPVKAILPPPDVECVPRPHTFFRRKADYPLTCPPLSDKTSLRYITPTAASFSSAQKSPTPAICAGISIFVGIGRPLLISAQSLLSPFSYGLDLPGHPTGRQFSSPYPSGSTTQTTYPTFFGNHDTCEMIFQPFFSPRRSSPPEFFRYPEGSLPHPPLCGTDPI